MRTQQKIWQEEHATAQTLPSEMTTTSTWEPSQYVVRFHEFLKQKNITSGTVVDIGAGKGRNTLYMAQQGFHAFALDYIKQATEHINSVAHHAHLDHLVQTRCMPVDAPWAAIQDNFFDSAIDCFASIDIETETGREICRNEMLRTLKPGGYALIVVCAAEDEFEQELIKNSPGPEKNSSIWPSGKFQKNYDQEELRTFYQQFKVIELETIQKNAHKLGRDFMATNYSMIIQKRI